MTEQHARYADADLPVEERVADLLERMTRREKIAQLGSAWAFEVLKDMEYSPEQAAELLEHGIGQITRVAGATSFDAAASADLANSIQRHLVEETRLGIPAVVHEEVCSGVMARETTIFPQAIGVASSFDPSLNQRIADVIRGQMRAAGSHQGLSPVLDVCRDARWGRLEETYGEDPHLVAAMGVAFVRGLQGETLAEGVVATAKHFVGYGASEGGMNWAPAHIPPRELQEVYLHPFEAAVREAGLHSVMNGYHELDGVPCGADRDLLTGTLREVWGFEGTVVSDYLSVDQLSTYHRLAVDQQQAAAMALNAGIDVELPGTDCYAAPLDAAIEAGDVDEAVLDEAVRRVLRQKVALGLFEDPYVDASAASAAIDTDEHRALALEVARRTMVLLKNDGGRLPLDGDGSVAVIGPNAHEARHLLGDYTFPVHAETLIEQRDADNILGMPIPDDLRVENTVEGIPTVLDELRARLDDRVSYAAGCSVTGASTAGFDEAVRVAAEADVAVLVVGDKSGLVRDCTSGESRDRSSLDLPGVQEDLVRAVAGTGTPLVVVLVGGRPQGSTFLHEHADAVVQAWLPGQAGAQAVAEVLTGEVNPSGKLPVSHPRSVGQVPVFYGHKKSGGRSHWQGDYVDSPTTPRYPFGHGLSYTTFALDGASVETAEVPLDGIARVRAVVRNTGEAAGEEVVQLYVRDPEASVTRPVLELKAFARVALAPGEARTVEFGLPTGLLGFCGRDLGFVVEPGRIEVHLGFSSGALTEVGELTITADGEAPEKAFAAEVEIR